MRIINTWRRTRRAAHESLTRSTVRDYHPILQKEAVLLASALLSSPEAREKHFQRSAASETMSILYDYPTLETEDDKTLKEIHAFNDYVSEAAVPGAHLVELFPWMMHIPDRWVLVIRRGLFFIPNAVSVLQSGSVRPSDISLDIQTCSKVFLIMFARRWWVPWSDIIASPAS